MASRPTLQSDLINARLEGKFPQTHSYMLWKAFLKEKVKTLWIKTERLFRKLNVRSVCTYFE